MTEASEHITHWSLAPPNRRASRLFPAKLGNPESSAIGSAKNEDCTALSCVFDKASAHSAAGMAATELKSVLCLASLL